MSNRKISKCLNIRVSLGNFHHVELVEYAEESIDFNNDAERIAQEDKWMGDLTESIKRDLMSLANKIGNPAVIEKATKEVEGGIKSKIPEWLGQGPVPNIANQAQKKDVQITAIQANVEKKDKEFLDGGTAKPKPKVEVKVEQKVVESKDEDLFDTSEDIKQDNKKDSKKSEEDDFDFLNG